MKFNKQSATKKTINLAGGEAYIESDKLHLVSILLTSMVQDQHYRKSDETLDELVELIKNITDKKFVAKSAIYARTKFGMRSITHAVAGEIAKFVKGEDWTKSFFDKIVYRPDDMTEIMSYYINKYGKRPIPHCLRKGFAAALRRLKDYDLAKYRKDNADVKMVDIINLVRPISTPSITKLIKGKLKLTGPEGKTATWEASLTKVGQKAETEEEKETLKADVWEKLLKNKKLGYFALLRNLRNIIEQAPEMVDEACKQLVNEKNIKNSLVLPFRFTTAIKEIEKISGRNSRKVMDAIDEAVDISLSNVPEFAGETLVVVDGSGSMEGKPLEIASLFAAMLVKSSSADFMTFSGGAEYVNLKANDSTLSVAKKITDMAEGGGTNFHAIFEEANQPYDRIIILSDMQGWIGYDTPKAEFTDYKKRTGADPKIYSVDLAGYGTLQFPEKNVFCLAGFSEKIFDLMKLMEQDRNVLIAEIEKIEL